MTFTDLESVDDVLIFVGVDLQPALDQVKGDDSGVGESARNGTSQSAEGVELHGSILTGILLSGGGSKGNVPGGDDGGLWQSQLVPSPGPTALGDLERGEEGVLLRSVQEVFNHFGGWFGS